MLIDTLGIKNPDHYDRGLIELKNWRHIECSPAASNQFDLLSVLPNKGAVSHKKIVSELVYKELFILIAQ